MPHVPSGASRRHGLGAVEHAAGDLQRAEHLAQLLLDVQEAGDADGVGQLHRQAAEELHLAEHARRGLAGQRRRRAAALVASSRLPGPPSITTRSQGTSTSSNTAMQSISSKRLLSGWSKRLCGPGATGSRQISLRPGMVRLDGERHGVEVIALGDAAAPGVAHDLFRDRRHRAEHLGAAHDDALVRLRDLAEVQERLLLLRRGARAVDLRVDQHVGEDRGRSRARARSSAPRSRRSWAPRRAKRSCPRYQPVTRPFMKSMVRPMHPHLRELFRPRCHWRSGLWIIRPGLVIASGISAKGALTPFSAGNLGHWLQHLF